MGDGRQILALHTPESPDCAVLERINILLIIINEYSQPSAGRRELLFHLRTILHHDRGS